MFYCDLDFMGDVPGRIGSQSVDPDWHPIVIDPRYK